MDLNDEKFYSNTLVISQFSTCISRKIGAIIVKDNIILSSGFNGPPRNVTRCGHDRILLDESLYTIPVGKRNLCPRHAMGFRTGTGLEHCTAIHAEVNAILNAYKSGNTITGATIYVTCGVPCRECLKIIINSGIVEVVCADIDDWYDELSKYLVRESGIKIRNYIAEVIS